MDATQWLNIMMEEEAIEGEEIKVSGEKKLVEAGTTSKKITVSQEAIQALPIKDISELYSLQSGVVKVEGGMKGAIPDHEERGLEEVHVRGGRSAPGYPGFRTAPHCPGCRPFPAGFSRTSRVP